MDFELKEEEEKKRKEEERRANIARKNYIKESEESKKRSYTSFGKLILADEINEPIWSLGKANRFAKFGSAFKETYSPGPKYSPPNEEYYKYRHGQKWKIGKGKRPPLNSNEKYEYYKHTYTKDDEELENLPKKWNKIRGCSMPLEARIKYDFRETVPGPGRYEPSYKLTKPHGFTYFIGEKFKTLTLNLLTGTDKVVGPGKYDVVYSMNDLIGNSKKDIDWGKKFAEVKRNKYTSIHQDFPIWSFGKGKRKELYNKTWTKNETYEIYSSVGDQIRTHKKSEPKINIGKSTRETEKFRGIFANTMDRIPSKISIPLPKI